jgi:hypothetical protein
MYSSIVEAKMALAEQRFARSDQAVREAGYRALIQALSVTDALRFVEQLSPGQGDYVDVMGIARQDQVFGDASVDEIYERAEAYWEETQKDRSSPAG